MSATPGDPTNCPVCQGTGWVKKYRTPQHPPEWSECRACLGTGRTDQKGDKQAKPDN